jgi:hypothetical protein
MSGFAKIVRLVSFARKFLGKLIQIYDLKF